MPVEPKALDVLQLLIARAPQVVDKAEIFSIVWKDIAVTDNALTRVVAQLRRTLDDDPKAPRYIETVATRGYALRCRRVDCGTRRARRRTAGHRVPGLRRGA